MPQHSLPNSSDSLTTARPDLLSPQVISSSATGKYANPNTYNWTFLQMPMKPKKTPVCSLQTKMVHTNERGLGLLLGSIWAAFALINALKFVQQAARFYLFLLFCCVTGRKARKICQHSFTGAWQAIRAPQDPKNPVCALHESVKPWGHFFNS